MYSILDKFSNDLNLFHPMVKFQPRQAREDSQVQGNSVVLSAAITACQLGQQPRMALDLLTADVGGAVPDAQAYTAAITACGTASA